MTIRTICKDNAIEITALLHRFIPFVFFVKHENKTRANNPVSDESIASFPRYVSSFPTALLAVQRFAKFLLVSERLAFARAPAD